MAAFTPHGALDCVIARAGTRSYAFVLFRSAAEARAALEALQGAKVKGASIRNELARPIYSFAVWHFFLQILAAQGDRGEHRPKPYGVSLHSALGGIFYS